MIQLDNEIKALSDSLVIEILNALGFPKTKRLQRIFKLFFAKATDRLAEIGVTFDRNVKEYDFTKAARQALTNWCTSVTARGIEYIPSKGPLLVVSNHPGTYDALAITSQLQRNDIRIIASDIPFLMNLPHASQHFFFISLNPHERMSGARAAIHHLQNNGSILIYGSGHIDPDPAIYTDADKHIDLWYPSIELFLRIVPQTRLLLSMVSNVVSEKWARHPITWLRQGGVDKRRLAEFGQVVQQLLFPGNLYLSPRMTFAPPITVSELRQDSTCGNMLQGIIARAKALLSEHMTWVYNS